MPSPCPRMPSLQVLLPENNTILNPWAPLFNTLLTALFMFWGSRLESQLKQLREEMQAMRRGLEAQSRSLNHVRYGQAGILILLASPTLASVGSLLGITP